MSDSPDDQNGGEQPSEGDVDPESQPPGEQPTGGHPQGGQPQGGQPYGGQPQGPPEQGQPGGGQPPQQYDQGTVQAPPGGYQGGPGYGEIFNRPSTMNEIKLGLAVFAGVSLGLGISGFGLTLTSGSAGTNLVLGGAGFVIIIGALFLSPVIAGVLGLRVANELVDQPTNLVYGTAAVIGFAGTIVAWIIGFVFFVIASNGQTGGGDVLGELLLPILVEAIGVAIAGFIAAWAGTNLANPVA